MDLGFQVSQVSSLSGVSLARFRVMERKDIARLIPLAKDEHTQRHRAVLGQYLSELLDEVTGSSSFLHRENRLSQMRGATELAARTGIITEPERLAIVLELREM